MKKLLSIVLAAILVFSCGAVAFAQNGNCDCGNTPLIVVSGMGARPYVLDAGTENEKQVFPPVIDAAELAGVVIAGLGGAAVTLDWNTLGDIVLPYAKGLFEEFSYNENGEPKYNVTTQTFENSAALEPDMIQETLGNEDGQLQTAVDLYGADHTYFFNYDWRRSPLENGKDLNALVKKALAETGHEKVDFTVCSMGGIQAMAYFAQFGGSDVESCVFLSSTFYGTYLVGDLFNKRIDFNGTNIRNYVEALYIVNDFVDELINVLFEVLDTTGIYDGVLFVVDDAVAELKNRVYAEILGEVFVTMPGLWALVKEEDYKSAQEILLDPVKHAKLIEKTDAFYNLITVRRDEVISEIMADGTNVSVCSHYNIPLVPVNERADEYGDALLETACTSGGATCALHGQTLPEDYVQAVNDGHNHVSPDRCIDASTCVLPESTWFFRNLQHVAASHGTQMNKFVFWLLNFEGQPTIFSNPDYPQFFVADAEENITPVGNTHDNVHDSTQDAVTDEVEIPDTGSHTGRVFFLLTAALPCAVIFRKKRK